MKKLANSQNLQTGTGLDLRQRFVKSLNKEFDIPIIQNLKKDSNYMSNLINKNMMRILKFEEMIDTITSKINIFDKVYFSLEQNNMKIKDTDEKCTKKIAEMRTANKHLEDKIDDLTMKTNIILESFKKFDNRLSSTSTTLTDSLKKFEDKFYATIEKAKLENVAALEEVKSLNLKLEFNGKCLSEYRNEVSDQKVEFIRITEKLKEFEDVNDKFLQESDFYKFKLENERNMSNLKFAILSKMKKLSKVGSMLPGYNKDVNLSKVPEHQDSFKFYNKASSEEGSGQEVDPKPPGYKDPEEVDRILSSMRKSPSNFMSRAKSDTTGMLSSSMKNRTNSILDVNNQNESSRHSMSNKRNSSNQNKFQGFRNNLNPIIPKKSIVKEEDIFRIGEEETSQINADLNLQCKIIEVLSHTFTKHSDLLALHDFTNSKEILFKKMYKVTKPTQYLDEDEHQRIKILNKFMILKTIINKKCNNKGSKLFGVHSSMGSIYEPNSAKISENRRGSIYYNSIKSQMRSGMISELRTSNKYRNRGRQGSMIVMEGNEIVHNDLQSTRNMLKLKKMSSDDDATKLAFPASKHINKNMFVHSSVHESDQSDLSNEGGESPEGDSDISDSPPKMSKERQVPTENNKSQEKEEPNVEESQSSSDMRSEEIRENVK